MWGGGTRPDILVSGAGVGGGEKTGKKGPIWTHPYKTNSGAKNSRDLKNSGDLTLTHQTLIPLLSLPPSPPVSLRVGPPGPGDARPSTQQRQASNTPAGHLPPPYTHPGHRKAVTRTALPGPVSPPTHTPSQDAPPETCTGHLLWFPPGDTSCVVLSAPARCPCPLGCWLSSSPPHTRGQPHFSEVTGSTLGSGHLPLLLTTSQPPRGHPGGTGSRRRGGPRVRRGQAGARRARCRWVAHLSVLG